MGLVRRHPDLAVAAMFLALPILWFNQVLWPGLSGKTLLPFDNLYAFEPWRSMRPDVVPYNPLVSDLVLENAVWELHARRSIMAGELPLWNAQILAGAPFLADAQGSVLYPPDLALYPLPLAEAFGWYTALHVTLAGLGMYALARALALSRSAGVVCGIAFMFSGAFITAATFPQVIGVAAWLPLLLAIVERILQHNGSSRRLWAAGVLVVGMQFLAGHPEISMYALLMVGAYVVARMASMRGRQVGLAAAHIVMLMALGTALAAVQLLPTLEAVGNNARTGARSATELAAVAWPLPQLWTLALPDLFGNPTHRQWLDIWSWTWRDSEPIFWGVKNYVEAGQYLGIATWLLAIVGIVKGRRMPGVVFGVLALVALLFALGSPLYLMLQGLPGFTQLRSPFRWILPFSVAVSMLAGLGVDALRQPRRAGRITAIAALAVGTATLAAVGLSVVQPEPFLKLAQRFVTDPAWAERAFGQAYRFLPQALTTPQMFWGYEAQGLLRLGVMTVAGGLLLLGFRKRPQVSVLALAGLVAVDLYSVHGRFLPASDVSLSPLVQPRPPVVQAIDERERSSGEPWRFTTFEVGDEKTFLANGAMYYRWQDARGYDSIVPRWYADFTRRLGLPIDSLRFNRIAPIYNRDVLSNTMLGLLNVKYVLTERRIDDPTFVEVYRDSHIAAYENATALPRSWVAPFARVLPPNQQPLETTDPRDIVYLEVDPGAEALGGSSRGTSRVQMYGLNDVALEVNLEGPAWVVLADSWGPGWQARARTAEGTSVELTVYRAYSTLRAVRLPAGGTWTVEFSYWPDSVKFGLLISAAAALLVVAVLVTSSAWVLALGRLAPNRPLHAPYSPAGRGA